MRVLFRGLGYAYTFLFIPPIKYDDTHENLRLGPLLDHVRHALGYR